MSFYLGILNLQQGCLMSIFIYLEGKGYMSKNGKKANVTIRYKLIYIYLTYPQIGFPTLYII